MSCPKCAKHRLLTFGLTIGDEKVTMRSCSHCGMRWWERDGRTVPLPKVLQLATTRR